MTPRSITATAAACVAIAAAGAAEPPELPGVTINTEKRRVDLAAEVCLDEGTLELVACTQGTKEHESIVAIEASAIHVHTALMVLGARNGSPAIRRRIEDAGGERWVDLPPRGTPVDVSLVVRGEDGKPVERPIADFLKPADAGDEDEAARKRFPTSTFLFAGSVVQTVEDARPRYLADLSGNVVTISTFGDELLCLPGMHSHRQGELRWQVDATHLPAVGSKVTLRLRPKREGDD